MQPKKLRVPRLTHHVASGQDVVYLREADGKRRMVYCGPHGSPEAQRRYHEAIADHLVGKPITTARRERSQPPASKWPTVEQLCAAYVLHAEKFYRDADGQPTGEVTHSLIAFRMLRRLYSTAHTDRITIRDLLQVRQALVELREEHEQGRTAPNGLSRRTVNDRMARIKRLFRWGVEQGAVPGAVWHELSALKGLAKGRCGVHDNPAVEAVPWALVESSLKHMVPTVRAAVEVQWWSGMRPAEVLAMTRRQLDTTGETWLYKPEKHKGSWRGRERVVALGPNAQAVLRPRLSLGLDVPVFSARTAWEEFVAEKRARRQTPETKQTRERDARRAGTEPVAEFFTVDEYRRAIERACDRAEVPRWSPHRLRHAAGTRIAKEIGIEAARAALGHSDVSTTRRYAHGADVAIAKSVAGRLG
jgi:integrase